MSAQRLAPQANWVLLTFVLYVCYSLSVLYWNYRVPREELPQLPLFRENVRFNVKTLNFVHVRQGSTARHRGARKIYEEAGNSLGKVNKFYDFELSAEEIKLLSEKTLKAQNSLLTELIGAEKFQSTEYFIVTIETTGKEQEIEWTLGQKRLAWTFSNATPGEIAHSLGCLLNNAKPESRSKISDYTLDLSFSLLNGNLRDESGVSQCFEWDFSSAFERMCLGALFSFTGYLEAFTQRLSHIYKFEAIHSQVKFYTNTLERLRIRNDRITTKELTRFMGLTSEWNIESSVSSNTTSLQFMLYALAPDASLNITTEQGRAVLSNAITIPDWGGVVFWKPFTTPRTSQYSRCYALSAEELLVPFNIFMYQLREFLGVQQFRDVLKSECKCSVRFHSVPLSDWEWDYMAQQAFAQRRARTIDNLRSLYALLDTVSELPVNEEVRRLVSGALEALRLAEEKVDLGMHAEGLKYANSAFEHSKNAFFHESMFSLLHFDLQNLLGVYLPFILPVAVSIFSEVWTRIKELRAKRTAEHASKED